MKYYVQLFSPHGLIRFKNAEIGRDKDTGGQVKYVLELLEALSLHPAIRKVDLVTRKIADKRVSPAYAEDIEVVNEKARIVRIQCGGLQYREKEQLWNYLDEFVDKTIRFTETQNDIPDIMHGHYADGNYIARELSRVFNTRFIATGHSLGRNKRDILLKEGLTAEKINARFNMEKRIREEEETLKAADAVIISTRYEMDSQYRGYGNRHLAKFRVIPPGINHTVFYPYYKASMPGFTMTTEEELALLRINSEIERFLFAPEKPLILSIGRADKRKNFETIITSYGRDKELQTMANLAIFAGVRKDISVMPPDEQETLTNLLLLMDKYDLYGKMAIPKKNDPFHEVPEIYRVAARKKGVFVNATPGENFGLTIVEAAASGLPVVASPTGGPKEIVENARNGLLVNVDDPAGISQALKRVISDHNTWDEYSKNGIITSQETYSWTAHAARYIDLLDTLHKEESTAAAQNRENSAWGNRLLKTPVFFISDLDGTLIEEKEAPALAGLMNFLGENRQKMIFGISTGRNVAMTRKALEDHPVLAAAALFICSVGTEIYYTQDFLPDRGWEKHIRFQWKREKLKELLNDYPGLTLQEDEAQTPFKLSYYVGAGFGDDQLADLHHLLHSRQLRARLFLTDNRHLDLVPPRAGKGKALHYLAYKWKKDIRNFIVAGNGGNDLGMLGGRTNGIVVSNHSPELEVLKENPHVYFASTPLAEGVMEGIHHYLHTGKLLPVK